MQFVAFDDGIVVVCGYRTPRTTGATVILHHLYHTTFRYSIVILYLSQSPYRIVPLCQYRNHYSIPTHRVGAERASSVFSR